MPTQSEYLRSFLQPAHVDGPLLGEASRYFQTTSKRVDAAKFLYYLLLYSPNTCELEQEYLTQLRTLPHPASQIIDELSAPELPEVADWARRLSECLPPPAEDSTSVLPSLTKVAAHYFNNVALTLWNLSGKSTPDVSYHPALDTNRVNNIRALIREAKEHKRKPSLKLLVQIRDAPRCPITDWALEQEEVKRLCIVAQVGETSELAHIIPFSLHNKTHAHHALEMFTGHTITAEDLHELINAPENALLLESGPHQQYDLMRWGIEAVPQSDGSFRYFSRPVRADRISPKIRGEMNKELFFGTNPLNEDHLIRLPDPRFCNIMLAVMRVLYMSGAADVLDELRRDEEHSREAGSSMGISPAFDNLFLVKLHNAFLSRVKVE